MLAGEGANGRRHGRGISQLVDAEELALELGGSERDAVNDVGDSKELVLAHDGNVLVAMVVVLLWIVGG